MKEILENNPKCTELIRNYYRTTFLNNFKSHLEPDEIQEYFTKMNLGIDELATLVESNPIYLVYMFDEKEIFIQTGKDIDRNGFFFAINGNSVGTGFINRKKAEKASIIAAIKHLETKL